MFSVDFVIGIYQVCYKMGFYFHLKELSRFWLPLLTKWPLNFGSSRSPDWSPIKLFSYSRAFRSWLLSLILSISPGETPLSESISCSSSFISYSSSRGIVGYVTLPNFLTSAFGCYCAGLMKKILFLSKRSSLLFYGLKPFAIPTFLLFLHGKHLLFATQEFGSIASFEL